MPFDPARAVPLYRADPDRYERMSYRRVGAQRHSAAGDLARAVAELRRRPAARGPPRDPAPRVRPRHHALRPRQQLRPALRRRRDELRAHLPRGLPPLPRRADHLDEGRLRPVARARTASGARASTCSRASTRASRAWASTTSTSSTRTASTPTRRCEETMGALDTAVRQGKALYVGISSYSPAAHRGGDRDPRRARHAAADPPAVLLAAEPLDRARPARRARAPRRRRDRVLAARAGPAHRPLPARHPRGLARARRRAVRRAHAQRGEPRARARAERDRAAARAVARPARDRLGAARPPRQLRADRRRAASSSSSRTSPRSRNLDFSAEELAEIDRHAVEGGIDLWAPSSSA